METVIKEKLEKLIIQHKGIIEKIEASLEQVPAESREQQEASLNHFKEELAFFEAKLAEIVEE